MEQGAADRGFNYSLAKQSVMLMGFGFQDCTGYSANPVFIFAVAGFKFNLVYHGVVVLIQRDEQEEY